MLVKGMDSFFKYLKGDKVLWLDSVERTLARIQLEFNKAQHIYDELENKERLSKPEQLFLNEKECSAVFELTTLIEFNNNPYFKGSKKIEFSLSPQPSFNKNFDLLKEDFLGHQKKKFTNFLFSNQPKQIERLYQIFEDISASIEFTPMNSALHEGFICKESKIVCYTDHQIFERYHRFRLKEGFRQAKQALTLKEIYNLQKGDYVTHIDHGVGQFSGLETIDVNGKPQETIRLIYKEGDVLYVGIHSLHRISKFTGKDGSVPK